MLRFLNFVMGFFVVMSQAQDFTPVDSLLMSHAQSLYNENVVVMVYHHDSLLYYRTVGDFDSLTVKPVASISKNISASVMLRLMQQGYFHPDDSLGLYLPLATQKEKGHSTIRQNFSHTAGWESTSGITFLTDPDLTLKQAADSIIVHDDLLHSPGSGFNYGGVSMQLAARVAEITTGENWNTLWEDLIQKPLAMHQTSFDQESLPNPIVAGGMRSSPADIMRFARFVLRNGKNHEGVQIIDSLWMQKKWQDQTQQAPVIYSHYPFNPPYNNPYDAEVIYYGFGSWLDIHNPRQNFTEQISGSGALGSIFWVNRCNHTAGVIFTHAHFLFSWPVSFQIIDFFNDLLPGHCYGDPLSFPGPDKYPEPLIVPNPASGPVKVELYGQQLLNVEVYNIQGVLLKQSDQAEFSIAGLPEGVLIVLITTPNGTYLRRLIKE